MEIDLPEVVAEVRAAFERYEKTLNANDVDVLDASFWNDPRTLRYSLTDNGYGFAAIHASRLARPRTDMTRTIMHTLITTFGRRPRHRQYGVPAGGVRPARARSQTWVRMPEGWRVVSAHVPFLPTT